MIRIAVIAFAVVMFLATASFGLWTVKCEDFLSNTRVTAEITVPKQNGFNVMYENVIAKLNPPFMFREYLIRVKEIDLNMKYGYYKVEDTPLKDFLNDIILGKQSTMKITFPEGYNTYDMAARVGRFIVDDGEEFLRLTRDKNYIYELTGQNLESLEGYLYPSTYTFEPMTRPKKVIKTLYWYFKKQLPADIESRAAALGMSVNDIIILASIIQKETYDPAEAPLISSVYHNRLKKGMRLQADPTVIYGLLPEFDGNLRKRNLQDPSNPYNTYRHGGLPPTPICSPTRMAINAALYPADTDYLYFVADKNHRHTFSVSYDEHREKVNVNQKQ
ncbi:endolytic transglycosylase MltG [Seleniivibrio woodruffii]|uniref:endolytic transglycosylase MltG n=1 Tax=Seleniivibrio woodruffii TaxID=1078050 RepID=UPI0026EEB7B9|nr:endolytic transglycosylase MltG [Seleniivibrio woodruffii]